MKKEYDLYQFLKEQGYEFHYENGEAHCYPSHIHYSELEEYYEWKIKRTTRKTEVECDVMQNICPDCGSQLMSDGSSLSCINLLCYNNKYTIENDG